MSEILPTGESQGRNELFALGMQHEELTFQEERIRRDLGDALSAVSTLKDDLAHTLEIKDNLVEGFYSELLDNPELYQAIFLLNSNHRGNIDQMAMLHRLAVTMERVAGEVANGNKVPVLRLVVNKALISEGEERNGQGSAPKVTIHTISASTGFLAEDPFHAISEQSVDEANGVVVSKFKSINIRLVEKSRVSSSIGSWNYYNGEETWLVEPSISEHENAIDTVIIDEYSRAKSRTHNLYIDDQIAIISGNSDIFIGRYAIEHANERIAKVRLRNRVDGRAFDLATNRIDRILKDDLPEI